MSNSVVKVTDSMLSDSLLLLVGEDGTVTPSKDVVEAYLNGKSTSTDLQVMHISKSDDQSVEVAIDNMLYVPDMEEEYVEQTSKLNEIANNLHNIKLDHDYTSLTESTEEVDELAKTLSILEGGDEELPKTVDKSQRNEENILSPTRSRARVVITPKTSLKSQKKVRKSRSYERDDDYYEELDGEDTDEEWEDNKQKKTKRIVKQEVKKDPKLKSPKPPKPKEEETKLVPPPVPQSPQVEKLPDKKIPKKEKKTPKPIPDDFALFSTPDIIRRVGGKEPTTPITDNSPPDNKPAKIEGRSKSVTDSPQLSVKPNRLSLDSKSPPKPEIKKDRKLVDTKTKRNSLDSVTKKSPETLVKPFEPDDQLVGDVSSVMDENKFLESQDLSSADQSMTLDGTGLDLDPTLLENINSDLISEDILYQVAQSLVSNTELQNAIDKSLSEDNLNLESVHQIMEQKVESVATSDYMKQESSSMAQKGTQIVRPDGRIVVIPPIERPTTRSRNKTKEVERQIPKFTHKPLDEEHVSGNELDSSGEEEESEDDPNKLWCICNQPHNNRFMICCDTCEEWYHGKCVNITKAMGQQMESEGREWICLFCKDPMLRRPQAAARRIRKASRNSRQSTDSTGSNKTSEASTGSVPCVVCQKPSRSNSIFCSETCILAHAQGVERVVVFERSTGNMLTGNKAPSAANLEQWLKEHPGYEVVRSAGKLVTTKTHNISQSKLKLVKSSESPSLHSPKRGQFGSSGPPKHFTKSPQPGAKTPTKTNLSGFKIVSKQVSTQPKPKVVQTSLNKDSASTPSKVKVVSSSVKSSTGTSKERSVPVKTPKSRQIEQTSGAHNKQENIRENVQKTVFEQLTNRLKMAEDLTLSEEELKNISTEIESQLYKCFGDTGQKYRNKYRSLIFNIKDIKNQTLWRRICEKSINPYQLVRLSPDDMASQELALWREREAKHQLDMIKKSELELLKCNRQYVLKTHKGEQILEDNRPTDNIDNSEVITSLTDASNGDKSDAKKDSSKDGDRKGGKHSHKDKDRKSSKDKSDGKDHHHRPSSKEHDRSRKRSRSRDRSKHGDRRRSRSRGRDRHKKSSHKSSRHKKDTHRGSSTDKLDKKSKEILEQLVDNKIVPPLEDRLWKHVSQEDIVPTPVVESDSDHEPTSTVSIPTPPHNNETDEYVAGQIPNETKNESKKITVKEKPEEERASSPVPKAKAEEIWRGVINMVDVAQISITAHEVSGDCHGLGAELPSNLDIVGRISPDTVWDYIGKMKCSNSKIISVVRLNAINVEEKMPYLALYSYLSSRNRLGVVKSTNRAVKDFYILPLASQKPIPQALLPISGPGFGEARPALLLGILVRDKRKRPLLDPVSPVIPPSVKKTKTEPVVQVTPPPRSYTPPPMKDPRLKLPLPPSIPDQDDEPYSPEDSDPDSMAPSTTGDLSNNSFLERSVAPSQAFQPFVNKFDDIPGLDNATLPSSTQEIQRQMEKLNKEIEMQKSEINSISQNIATASTEIGQSALANIALPSNLQQILDSIKTIGSAATLESLDLKATASAPAQENADLTIPLILPTTFSRHSNSSTSSENTIPLNLPGKKKTAEADKSSSVLSSLSEEDLIRKAEEMLGDSNRGNQSNATSAKRPKLDLEQPPVPGLEDGGDKI